MTRKASIIYLCIAPFLFLLSWYISHKIFQNFLSSNVDNIAYVEHSMMYASFLTVIYLVVFFVIRDLYKSKTDSFAVYKYL